ncbi:glycopeptide antibiotics resistance protein [Bacillus pumilus]|uniref:VanZ family protein n=1 Tax=Bacillus TaxID=1386 RepID=UPI0027834A34|nr:VanZ family protein [Bacillus pumilus]MDQ0818646.1 glycopeptide antibiotics resistance protein [Bacillus pumilus]
MIIFFEGWILYSFLFIYMVFAVLLKLKYKKSYTYLLFFSTMTFYVYHVINLTQFPITIDDTQRENFQEVFGGKNNVLVEMNLIPFSEGFSLANFYNVFMTIPLGFGLPFLIKATFKKIFSVGLLVGILFESFQLIVGLYAGYSFRVVDIDDIIYNLLGTLIGYVFVFKLFIMFFKLILSKFEIDFNPIISHIYDAGQPLKNKVADK